MPNILIRNGIIVDGTGREGFRGSVHVVGDRIKAVIPSSAAEADGIEGAENGDIIDAGGLAVAPGFIDCHTHALWAGDRLNEHLMRLAGASYQDIPKAGGGILSTVEATRRATAEELRAHGRRWLDEMGRHGVTTVEAAGLGRILAPCERDFARTGANIKVAIRPEKLHLLGKAPADASHGVRGRVAAAAYLGDRSHFYVEIDGLDSPLAVAAQNVDESLAAHREAGSEVWLSWRDEAVVLLPIP